MNMVSVLVASVIGMMAVMATFQGLASAAHTQVLLKRKTDLVIESQGINNVLQDAVACKLSIGKQIIYYSNGVTAYQPDSTVSSFGWTIQGTTTVLTIKPKQPMLRAVVLNLNCYVDCSDGKNKDNAACDGNSGIGNDAGA